MAALDEVYERIPGRCNSCRHYDASPFGRVNYGFCRRWPPMTVDLAQPGLPKGIWPVVAYDDLCGEHASG